MWRNLVLASMLTAAFLQQYSQVAAEDHRRRWSVLIQLRVVIALPSQIIFNFFGGLISEREGRGSLASGCGRRFCCRRVLGVNSVQTLKQNDSQQQQKLSTQQNITHGNHFYSHNVKLSHLKTLFVVKGDFWLLTVTLCFGCFFFSYFFNHMCL